MTTIEYELQEGATLVSRTDLKGCITYVNPAFVEASNFTKEELIGSAHNIVRHPDMPEEAFADFWTTLGQGLPWTGLVKNRRKTGDFYWVLANVTPIQVKGRTQGFMSVRSKPARSQILEVEQIYRKFKEGTAEHLAIRQGNVVRRGWRAAFSLSAVRLIPIKDRIALSTGLGAALVLVLGALGWWQASALVNAPGGQSGLPALIAMVCGAGALAMAGFGYFIVQTILKPLDKACEVARAIAGGDLLHKFATAASDETGQLMRALNQMSANLVAVVSDVAANVDTIATAS
ncbi:methyl-accepting chemotaxis protein, partial [Polaromonas sp. UBA4122]|uniref:methyl-accepting chemotaxis protein n=1 Tax=Polaromonas sp. UBA4122 TaxID=1947074 RepID=UPI0025D48BE3